MPELGVWDSGYEFFPPSFSLIPTHPHHISNYTARPLLWRSWPLSLSCMCFLCFLTGGRLKQQQEFFIVFTFAFLYHWADPRHNSSHLASYGLGAALAARSSQCVETSQPAHFCSGRQKPCQAVGVPFRWPSVNRGVSQSWVKPILQLLRTAR